MPLIDSPNEVAHRDSRKTKSKRSKRSLLVAALVFAIVAAAGAAGTYGIEALKRSLDHSRPNVHRTVTSAQALTRALADANTVGGGVITLAGKDYHLNHGLELSDNVTIDGQNATLTISSNEPAAVSMANDSNLRNVKIRVVGDTPTIVLIPGGTDHVSISGCQLIGSANHQSGVVADAPVTNLSISETSLSNVKNGITLDGPSHVKLNQVRVSRWTTRGFWILGSGSHPATHVTLAKLDVRANIGHGQSRYPITVMTTGVRNNNVTVENSRVIGRETAHEDPRRPGTADQISVTETDGVRILNNTSVGGGERGINVTSSTDVTVEGNTVARSDASGIGIGSGGVNKGNRNVIVTHNRIANCGLARMGPQGTPPTERTGIRLVQLSQATVSDNRVTVASGRPKTYGITVFEDKGVTVRGNVMSGPMWRHVLWNAG